MGQMACRYEINDFHHTNYNKLHENEKFIVSTSGNYFSKSISGNCFSRDCQVQVSF